MGFAWGGAAAAGAGSAAQSYMAGIKQYQQMADELQRRKLLAQEFEKNQRQAGMQDQLLQAQIAHMQRPDINAQRYADEQRQAIGGAALSPYTDIPGATAMPQPPQGGVPSQFQGAQPMPGVSPGMPQPPQGQPGMQPNPFANPDAVSMGLPQPLQGQPQGMPPQGQPQGMPPGMAGMQQPVSPGAMPPQGQPQGGMPQQPANSIEQRVQVAMDKLRAHIQALPPARSQKEQYDRAVEAQQAEAAIHKRAAELRAEAQEQLKQRIQQEHETTNRNREDWRKGQEGGRNTRAASALSAMSKEHRRDEALKVFETETNSIGKEMVAGPQADARRQAAWDKYKATLSTLKEEPVEGEPGAAPKVSDHSHIPPEDLKELRGQVTSGKFKGNDEEGYEVPDGTELTTKSGKRYRAMGNQFELVK